LAGDASLRAAAHHSFRLLSVRRALFFRDFSQVEERIGNGLKAFATAAEVGWPRVEACLRRYEILDAAFFQNSVEHFTRLRERVLAMA